MDNNIRRIGVLAPSGNIVMERELPRHLPPGIVTIHNRLSRPGTGMSKAQLVGMMESLERAAKDIAQSYPEIILYGCTSGSFLLGVGHEGDAGEKIKEYTGIPGITTSVAVDKALKAINARRVFMLTPYPDDINEAEVAFLHHRGVEVVSYDSFRCPTVEALQKISSEQVAELVLKNRELIKRCDAVFISCTGLLTMDKIEYLEAQLGMPVVSSNQATLWAGLVHMKVNTSGLGGGRLFKLAQPHLDAVPTA